MTFTRRHFLMGALATPLVLSGRRARAEAPPAARTHLTLLHTNDTHSRLDPFPGGQGNLSHRGGMARRAHLIRTTRAQNPHTLVLDAGDTFQGTPFFNRYKGTLDYELMSMAGYDATTLGNHDFDGGLDGLVNAARFATFDVLASYDVARSSLASTVKPHVIREVGGLKVGIFGLSVVLDGLVNPRLIPGVAYRPPVDAARAKVEELRALGCHAVIALSHLGHQGCLGEPGDLHWPQQVAGVDYVVGGHTHTFLDEPVLVAGPGGWKTAVMQVGFAGVNLGHANLVFEGPNRVSLSAAPMPVLQQEA